MNGASGWSKRIAVFHTKESTAARVARFSSRLGCFNIPVAELVPEETPNRFGCVAEIVGVEERTHAHDRLAQTGENPPIGQRQALCAGSVIAGGNPSGSASMYRVAFQILLLKLRASSQRASW